MAKRRNGRAAHDGDGAGRDWTHLLAVGLLFGSVLGALIGGAVLSVEPAPVRTIALDRNDDRAAPAPARTSTESTAAGVDRLAARAEADLERVATAGAPWTAQLAVLCDAERAHRVFDEFASATQLYVLPTYHDGRACFVFCWNRYANADRAREAADLPHALADSFSGAFPKRLADVLKGLQ